MSALGSRPKIASGSSIKPAALPSSDTILSSMSGALLVGGFAFFGGRGLGFAGGGCRLRQAELTGLGGVLRQLLLHRVAQRDPAALGARHRAFDQDEAALDVGLHHLEIERGDALDAHVTRHFLVLEGLAGILAAAGRTDRAMRDRHAVRGAQPAEVPALHATRKAVADRGPGHVDKLPDDEVIGGDFGTDRDEIALLHPELGELALGLDLGDGEMAAVRLGQVLRPARAGAELQRHVAVLVLGAVGDDLAIGEAQHCDRHVLAAVRKDARHSDLLCDHPGTHVWCPVSLTAQSLISTSTPAARSSFISASTVCGVGSTMSSSRLCVRISNCSRLFLSMCGERLTVNFSILVGSGIGPRTCAPVRLAVATISRVDASRMRCSNALSRIRIFWPFMVSPMAASCERQRQGTNAPSRSRYLSVLRRRSSVACYSVMLTTTPAPTVLPPSRIANRCFSSIAIGVINSTSMVALSPGMIISVPAGSVHCPVTSVVRK